MKKSLVVFGILIIAAGTWLYWSPRLAAKQLREAARSGDVEALDELVDFPLVREQLKADLKATLLASVSNSDETSGVGTALAAGLGGLMVDGVVNQVVSPSGIAALVRFGNPDSASAQAEAQLITRMRHRNFNTFVVTARNVTSPPADTLTFTFRRSGISWRLVRLGLPRLK